MHTATDSITAAAKGISHDAADRRTLDTRVYERLREEIMNGSFEPGEVVTLRGLAAMLGTSLMPVRNAVNRLAVEHALIAKPNRSIALPRLTLRQFDEVTQIRLALEPLAARLGARNIDAVGIEALAMINEKMHCAEPAEYFRLNQEFHFGLYAAAESEMLFNLIRGTWLRIGPLLNHIGAGDIGLSSVSHDWPIAALRRGDPDDVAASIEADIRSAAHVLRPHLAEG